MWCVCQAPAFFVGHVLHCSAAAASKATPQRRPPPQRCRLAASAQQPLSHWCLTATSVPPPRHPATPPSFQSVGHPPLLDAGSAAAPARQAGRQGVECERRGGRQGVECERRGGSAQAAIVPAPCRNVRCKTLGSQAGHVTLHAHHAQPAICPPRAPAGQLPTAVLLLHLDTLISILQRFTQPTTHTHLAFQQRIESRPQPLDDNRGLGRRPAAVAAAGSLGCAQSSASTVRCTCLCSAAALSSLLVLVAGAGGDGTPAHAPR